MKTKARHTLINGWDQHKLSRATVVVAGVGAIGSHTAVALARIGVGEIIAVDNDVLEEHNIYNQVYLKGHIGQYKVDALREIIEKISDTSFIAKKVSVQSWLSSLKVYPEPDIYLGCFDNVGSRFYLNYIAVSTRTPYIDAGIEGYTGNVRTVIPFKTPCLQCWSSMFKEDEIKAGCSYDSERPSSYLTSSYASMLQTMQLLNILFRKEAYPFISFNLEKGITRPVELKRNEECGLCGTKHLTE